MTSHPQSVFGVGLYSFADAARFIGAKPPELRRWMIGYTHKSREGEATFSPPLWVSQTRDLAVEGLGFKDLIELRFVHTFRDAGVPIPLIRKTLAVAREQLSTPFPFTCERFRTDGQRIFMDVVEASGDRSLVDIVKQQNVIAKVIGPSLREGVELDMRGGAARWFPLKKSRAIVFDPTRKFGQPILAEYDIPTAAIRDAVLAEQGNEKRVAIMFGVTVAAVRKAVEFETRARFA